MTVSWGKVGWTSEVVLQLWRLPPVCDQQRDLVPVNFS